MATPRVEKAYEKLAWVFLFGIGALFFIGAVTHIAGQGVNDVDLGAASTSLANFVRMNDREQGIGLGGFSALVMAISRFSYRKGDQWAWYALLIVPLFVLGGMIDNILAGQTSILFFSIPLVIISLLGLLLPYRKFFPRKQASIA